MVDREYGFERWCLVSRDEAKRAGAPGWTACVVRVIYPVQNGNLGEVERAYAIQHRDIHTVLVLVRSTLMVSINSAF